MVRGKQRDHPAFFWRPAEPASLLQPRSACRRLGEGRRNQSAARFVAAFASGTGFKCHFFCFSPVVSERCVKEIALADPKRQAA